MRFVAGCVIFALLLGFLIGCGPQSDGVSGDDTQSKIETTSAPSTGETEPASEEEAREVSEQPVASSAPVSQSIAPTGGEILVNDPASPISGLTIAVPEGAYADVAEFAVSHRPFEGELPENVTALTRVITVENGGEYAGEIMTVTIPIELPEDHFAMGFFLHEDGSLEGMPLVALSKDSITIATRHFSEFFIGMVADALLAGTIDSRFRPGRDDWHFDNVGSYIAPKGHCAGQALSAMWYYTERTLRGAPALYGRYDSNGGDATPTLWQDDSHAYRLASVVQHDMHAGAGNRLLRRLAFEFEYLTTDELNWRAFLCAMLVTDEPQFVGIMSTKEQEGHAMIVYKADADAGMLYVADPNYPGNTSRVIRYAEGKFLAYESGANKKEIESGNSVGYDKILYLAKSAVVEWPRIAARWAQLGAGTIGNDLFPSYELVCFGEPIPDHEGSGVFPLIDGLSCSKDRIFILATSGEEIFLATGYSSTGERLALDEHGNLLLQPGENRIGLEIKGRAESGSGSVEYVDFRWLTIERGSEEIQLTIEAQVHADIRRINQPDEVAGFERQTEEHDTPFEKIKILSYEGATQVGQTYRASWQRIPNEEGDATHAGWIKLELDDDGTQILTFEAFDVLTYEDGGTREARVKGGGVPKAEGSESAGQFILVGEDICATLRSFDQDWFFGSGDSREVLSYHCDEYSVIRITIR